MMLLVMLQSFICIDALGQSDDPEILKLAKEAEKFFSHEKYRQALPLFLQLEIVDQDNFFLKYKIGVCYLSSKIDYSKALAYLELVTNKLPDAEKPIDLSFYLAKAYHLNDHFDASIKYYTQYLSDITLDSIDIVHANRQIQMCLNGKRLVQVPVNAIVTNLGKSINSVHADYAPVISADQSILIFTSRREGSVGGMLDERGNYYEDVYVSTYKFSDTPENSHWMKPQNIGDKINTKLHDASVALSVDGRELFIYRGDHKGHGGAIYVSKAEGLSWSMPEKLGKNINTKNWVTSISLSAEGSKLYFTSDRKGGFGGQDIYVSNRLPSGEWGPGQNLGASVNTSFDEESPFIHPDGKTLYFSSKGHNSMGGFDIFKSVQNKNQWSQASNLGYPINSSSDDIHLVLSPNGRQGYFTSVRSDGFGEEDIHSVEIHDPIIPLTMVRGIIITDDEEPVRAKIKIIDNESNKLVKYVYDPNPETGQYLLIFPPGKNYDMIVEAKGYVSYSINLHIPNQTYFYELYQTMYLKTIITAKDTIGQGISIENTFYDVNDTFPDTYSTIEKVKIRREKDIAILSLIDRIIEATDSLSLARLDEIAGNRAPKTTGAPTQLVSQPVRKNYTPLVDLLEDIFEYTDSTALSNLDKIAEEGFFTKADTQAYFYGEEKNTDLLPIKVGNDTIYVIPPTVLEAIIKSGSEPDSTVAPVVEQKFDEIDIKTIFSLTVLFGNNQVGLDKAQCISLDELSDVLTKFPEISVSIAGHTDSIGEPAENLVLSKNRAKTIAAYFVSKNVKKSRLLLNAYGEREPIESNKTESGRRTNRRVEIKLIQSKMKHK